MITSRKNKNDGKGFLCLTQYMKTDSCSFQYASVYCDRVVCYVLCLYTVTGDDVMSCLYCDGG